LWHEYRRIIGELFTKNHACIPTIERV
jgi:hypothetical protein